ncbi:MAG: alpha/beta hydrolase [Clostridia bacterium]|nr:alpha/beta hydrolase [Clostridia bacterium]
MKQRKRLWIGLICIAFAILLPLGGCALFVCDYYPADQAAIAAMVQSDGVPVRALDGGNIAYGSTDAQHALIFYPGGKVEHTAYEPLLRALAARGILCILVKMPLRLAFMDVNAADGIKQQFPAVTHWYIGGHSLGGSIAATYLAKHVSDFDGLILLASYAMDDLSGQDLRALSLVGSEDGVLNRENYTECRSNLPADTVEMEIAGGNHAYFGAYGAQKGDGEATLTVQEQITFSADSIADFMKGE